MRILRSEQGFALIIAVVVALVIATLTASLHIYLQPLNQNQLRMKTQYETMVAIEDLSQILRRGYVEGQAGSCLTNQTLYTFGSVDICLPDNPCVTVSSTGQSICVAPTPQGIQVVIHKSWRDQLGETLVSLWNSFTLSSNVAEAQGVEMHRPTLGAVPQSTVGSIACPAHALCQNCGAANGAVCLRLAICPPGSDCVANPDLFWRQTLRFPL